MKFAISLVAVLAVAVATQGAILTNDFESETIGAVPTGFVIGNPAEASVAYEDGVSGNKVIKWAPGADERVGLGASIDLDSFDLRFRYRNTAQNWDQKLHLRRHSADRAATGEVIIRNGNADIVVGATTYANALGSATANQWVSYHIQFEGSVLRVSNWLDGSAEPAAWEFEQDLGANFVLARTTSAGSSNTPINWQWQGGPMLDDVTLSLIPEPATMSILGLGALALIRRRR